MQPVMLNCSNKTRMESVDYTVTWDGGNSLSVIVVLSLNSQTSLMCRKRILKYLGVMEHHDCNTLSNGVQGQRSLYCSCIFSVGLRKITKHNKDNMTKARERDD